MSEERDSKQGWEKEGFNETRYGRKNNWNPDGDFQFDSFILRNPTFHGKEEATLSLHFCRPKSVSKPFFH